MFKDTVLIFESEQVSTLHQVIECNRSARNFANDLHMNLNFRYANNGSLCKWRRTANFLAPQYKGIHLTSEALKYTKH